MADVHLTISVAKSIMKTVSVTNVSELNNPIKRQRCQTGLKSKKQDLLHTAQRRHSLNPKLERGWK